MLLINLDHHKKCPPCQSILRPATLVSSSILLHSARIYVNSSLALLTLIFFQKKKSLHTQICKFSGCRSYCPCIKWYRCSGYFCWSLMWYSVIFDAIIYLLICGTVFYFHVNKLFSMHLLPYNPYKFQHGHGLHVRLNILNHAIALGVQTVFVKDSDHNIFSVCKYAS